MPSAKEQVLSLSLEMHFYGAERERLTVGLSAVGQNSS